MKLKELDRNGNVAWSPKTCDSSYLAVGTASQQLDSSFSTHAQLEIFKYIPNQNNWDMPISASIRSESKFSKLLWGSAQNNNGFIVGGTENGAISIYDASSLLSNGKSSKIDSSRVALMEEHKGAVNAMDFNKFKSNLLATGGSDSDIFIWDLDKLEEPMTPGNKTQPLEDILSLAWNHKVQHILASTSTHRCQIWDLRKSDPVIKLSDSQMKMKCKKVVWHPDISTRLCISSEDDHTPIIQLWDLRYIQCPFHTFQKHTKGVVDLDWCLDDSDILMSVGKDRQLICWNMSTHNLSSTQDQQSDVIYEWQLDQEWINEARFCPKHPGLVSISSSDCHIGVYSLLGGRGHIPRELSDTVTESFPLDLYDEDGQESEFVKNEVEKAVELQLSPTPTLLKAPKWLKRPIGARFSFGGKLITFYKSEDSRSRNNSESQMSSATSLNECRYKVYISQVITDKNLIHASNMLVKAVEDSDSLLNYCKNKFQSITNHILDTEYEHIKTELIFDRNIWKFIECHLEEDSRSAFMNNLGYSETNFRNIDKMSNIKHDSFIDVQNDDFITNQHNDEERTPISSDNLLTLLPQNDESEKVLSIALLSGNIEAAINICLKENRSGEAVILAVSSGRQDLYDKVQSKILHDASKIHPTTQLIYVAVKRDWLSLVEKCDLHDWREALGWLLTYVSAEELADLCEILARRLEERSKTEYEYLFASCVCYICSGSIDNFVRCWLHCKSLRSNKELQRLAEMVILLCKSIGDEEFLLIKGEAANILTKYACLIAAQGKLSTALTYLVDNNELSVVYLRSRICEHLRNQLPAGINKPNIPFKISNIFNTLIKVSPSSSSQIQRGNKPVQHESSAYAAGFKVSDVPIPTGSYNVRHNGISNNSLNQNKMIAPNDINKFPKVVAHAPSALNSLPTSFFQPPNLSSSSTEIPPQINHSTTQMVSQMNLPTTQMLLPNQQVGNVHNIGGGVHSSKPSWNDPPLLSENYRRMHIQNKIALDKYEHDKNNMSKDADQDKSETDGQQQFYNPVNFIVEQPDISSIGNKSNMATKMTSSYIQSTHTITNQGISNVKNVDTDKVCELSSDKQHWKSSLYHLIELCKERDNSRQTKVKMEEINKKLEHLFDLLKAESLSAELLNGLAGLIVLVDSNNYRDSLDKVNQIIQTVNFSEAGSFLPSLKMLIQCVIKVTGS